MTRLADADTHVGIAKPGTIALIALGANLTSRTGAPDATLRQALADLAAVPGVSLRAVSRFWRTPAHPAGSGPDYINAAAAIATDLTPEALLAVLHRIEADLGRVRTNLRWQSRGIDLDLLAVGDLVAPDPATQDRWRLLPPDQQAVDAPPSLILPHPRLQDRGFVLVPLSDIAPAWVHPLTGQSTRQMLAALDRDQIADIVAVA